MSHWCFGSVEGHVVEKEANWSQNDVSFSHVPPHVPFVAGKILITIATHSTSVSVVSSQSAPTTVYMNSLSVTTGVARIYLLCCLVISTYLW
jgi:hypothetical protein